MSGSLPSVDVNRGFRSPWGLSITGIAQGKQRGILSDLTRWNLYM